MKFLKMLLLGVIFLTASISSYALTEISYSNFARTDGNGLLMNEDITVAITIIDSITTVYKETHTVKTNAFGLFTVKIGLGTPESPYNLTNFTNLVASGRLNVRAEYKTSGSYRFVALSQLLVTALKNEEAAGIVTLNDAYLNGNGIEVLPGFPVDLTGTGLIQSAATVAEINTNGVKTLTTKKYVDDAIAAIFPLKTLSVNEGLVMTPGPSYDGTVNQVAGIATGGVDNIKINDNTEFLAVEALTTAGTAGVDAGIYSVTDGARNLKFQGIGLTKITRTGNVIKIDGNDNWGSQVVITDMTLKGDGTLGNKLGVNNNWSLALDGSNMLGVNFSAPLYKDGTNKLGLKFDATLDMNVNDLSINESNPNTWLATQTFKTSGASSVIVNGATAGANPSLLVNGNADAAVTDVDINGEVKINGLDATDNNNELTVNGTVKINGITGDSKYDLVVVGDVAANHGDFFVDNSANNNTAFGLVATAIGKKASDPNYPGAAQGITAQAVFSGTFNPMAPDLAIGSVGIAQPATLANSVIAVGNYGGARNSNAVANIGNVGHAWNDMGHAFGTIGLVSQSASPINEIGAGLALTVKAGVLGINLGSNAATDYAGYFLGQVKATGTMQANQYIGALQYSVTQGVSGSGIKAFSFNNTAAATVAVDNDNTLGFTANQLGLNLSHSNTWNADQLLNATAAQGNNLVTAENLATAKSLNGDVVNYDATLQVTGHALGLDLTHENSWTAKQTFSEVDINGGTIDGTTIGADVAADGTFTKVTVKDATGNANFVIGTSSNDQAGWAKLYNDAGNELVTLGSTGNAGAVSISDGGAGYGAAMYYDMTDYVVGAGKMDRSMGAGFLSDANATASVNVFNSAILPGGKAFSADQDGNVFAAGTVTANKFNGAYTKGSVLFAAADGSITENNSQLYWDDAQGFLGINSHASNAYLNILTTDVLKPLMYLEGIDGFGPDITLLGGEILIAGNTDGNFELNINSGDGILLDAGAMLHVDGGEGIFLHNSKIKALLSGVDPNITNAAVLGIAAPADWAGYFDGRLYASEVDINGGTIDGTTIGGTTPADGSFTNVTVKDAAGNTNFVIGSSSTEDAGWAKLFTDAGKEIVILGTTGTTPNRAGAVSVTDVNGWGAGLPVYGAGMFHDPVSDNWMVGAGSYDLTMGAAILSNHTTTASLNVFNSSLPLGIAFSANQDGELYTAGFASTNKTALQIFNDARTNLFITKDYLQKYVFDADTIHWTGLSIFDNPSGPAIQATSSDAAAPTVSIQNTNPLGVALELQGASNATTALEITTGNVNIANGQLIVSSNTGSTGLQGNGPTLTLNNNGNGVLNENGGAVQIIQGHVALSYKRYAPSNGQDLTSGLTVNDQTYSVYDIVSNGNNLFQLPVSAATGNNYGTLLYIINSGTGTINITGYANINAGTTATYILTQSGWVRIN